MDLTPILAAGGIVGLFGAAGMLVLSFVRENSALRGEWKEQLDAVKADLLVQREETRLQKQENVICRIQVNGLIGLLRQSGIAVPAEMIRGWPDEPS